MAFNYGGRAEIVDAVRALVAEGTPANKVDEKAIRAPPLLPRHARPRPGHPHVGRDPHLELPALGDRLQRAGLPRHPLARHAPRATSTRRSSSSSGGCAASAPSTPDPSRRAPATGPHRPTVLRAVGDPLRPPSCENGGTMTLTRIADRVGIALLAVFALIAVLARRTPAPSWWPWSAVAIAADRRRQPALRPPLARRRRPGPGPAGPRGPRPGRRPWPPRPAGPWPRPPAGASATARLDPAHRTAVDAPTHGEPLPRQGRRPAHLPPGRGRPHRRLPDRAPRQGARRRQGRAQDHLEVRRPPRAADPRRPPAVAGEERPRHRQPGRGGRRRPGRPRGPRPPAAAAWRCSR